MTTTSTDPEKRFTETIADQLPLSRREQERRVARSTAAAIYASGRNSKASGALHRFAMTGDLDGYELLAELDAISTSVDECWIEALSHYVLFEGDRR